MAIAITALIVLAAGAPVSDAEQAQSPAAAPATVVDAMNVDADSGVDNVPEPAEPTPDPKRSLEEATTTVQDLFSGSMALLPKIVVAMLLLLLAWFLSRVIRIILHHALGGWEKSEAISALTRIGLFLLAIGAGLSVVSGDATTLVGSVGLIGLALSWALQTPIESFTGWVLNALRGYYRSGDRIEVGDVFGDVYRIDVLNTTVWELGGPGKAVAGAQPTGALVTFPNWEILRSSIINYSRDFPYVWDEISFAVADESDLAYVLVVFERVANAVVGDMMREPAVQYRALLAKQRLVYDVAEAPQVYLAPGDTWTNCIVRYLVPLRQRRRWSTDILVAISIELARPEHQGRILAGYPRGEIELRSQMSDGG